MTLLGHEQLNHHTTFQHEVKLSMVHCVSSSKSVPIRTRLTPCSPVTFAMLLALQPLAYVAPASQERTLTRPPTRVRERAKHADAGLEQVPIQIRLSLWPLGGFGRTISSYKGPVDNSKTNLPALAKSPAMSVQEAYDCMYGFSAMEHGQDYASQWEDSGFKTTSSSACTISCKPEYFRCSNIQKCPGCP